MSLQQVNKVETRCENVKTRECLRPRKVAHPRTGDTHFRVAPTAQCKSVFRTSARILVLVNDVTPMANADTGVSHVSLPMNALHAESQREIFAEHVTTPLCPLGRAIRKLQLTAMWTPKSPTLGCVNKSGTAHGLMQCSIKGDTPYFTAVQFWMPSRALQIQHKRQKTFPQQFWKQLYMTEIREGPVVRHFASISSCLHTLHLDI